MTTGQNSEERILILAPRGRDAHVIQQVLNKDGLHSVVCADFPTLLQELEQSPGAALIAEEALVDIDLQPLVDWLGHQPSWSDFPFVVLVSQQLLPLTATVARPVFKSLGNVVLLERPINADTLRSAAASALRGRRRQYQARKELRKRVASEERLNIALQAGRLGTWELSLADNSLYASDSYKENFGLDPAQPISYDDVLNAIHPDDRERRQQILQVAMDNCSEFDVEYRVCWPDGAVHWMHVRGKVNCDSFGKPTRIIGVSQDVTERVESERRLRESQEALMHLNSTLEQRIEERTAALAQANDRLMREMTERERAQLALLQTQKMEALGHLTSGISHDFNNLLSVIQGNAELVSMLSSDERLKRIASMIRKAAEQGAKLTGQLLTFSRGQRVDLKVIELNKTLHGIKDLLTSSLGSTIRVEYDLAPDIPPVRGDLNQIELSVLNLAINAKDAMPDGGTITIRTALHSSPPDLAPGRNYAVISVIDSGQGINPDILGKVFDPFFTTKPLGKGTGLGLSQVYGIAQQSGGTARIRSQVGAGTTVEIWLPCADVTEMMSFVPMNASTGSLPGKRARILVVEDDPQVRQFIVEGLEILGYQVAQAHDAQSCLDTLDDHEPDLLITDFLMPGMTGAELIKRVHAKRPELPAIMATGYADLEAVDAVINSSMVLRKPFQLTDLAHKVQQALPH